MIYTSVNFTSQQNITVRDRAFAFGDGVFTSALVSAGKVQLLPLHLQRLVDACQRLAIHSVPFVKVQEEMIKAAQFIKDGCLKVTITAGESTRGYGRASQAMPNIVVQSSAFPQHYPQWQTQGIRLGLSTLKLGINPMLAGLKHLNRLEQVLIRNELDGIDDVDELVVTDINGHVIECNSANLFWQQGDRWCTPDLTTAGVNGIIRQQLLAKLNPDIVHVDINELVKADSIFICNAILGIAPVRRLLNKALNIDSDFIYALQQFIKE